MIMLDDTTAIVESFDDLRDAVSSNNGIDLIFLGADITFTSGITIFPNKSTLIIDGTYNGIVHTLTDRESTDSAQTLGIRAESQIHLIIQNIHLIGRNYYGIPYVTDGYNTDNVTVEYINMTYRGKQVIYHIRGLTRFLDCSILITGLPNSEVEEVGQVCKVEIGGQTTMEKTNNEDSIFWFFGSSTRIPYLKILTNANVTITTAHYFMYESYSPDCIIESGASFTLNTNSGFSHTSSHTLRSFLVGDNASFYFTQLMNRGFASLYLDGPLTVGEGAYFYMQADFINNYPLIRFTSSTASLNLNTPRSFVLYNRGSGNATAFYFAANISFFFAGNQVNIWESPKVFPIAGTFDDIPPLKWNRPNWNTFQIRGRTGTSQTIIDSHDFTQEELLLMPDLNDLKLYLPPVFSVGNLPLSVNPIVIGTRPITGKTAKRARIRVSGAASSYPDCDADDNGGFTVTPTTPIPFGELFTVTSNIPFLLTTMVIESQEEGGLSIIEAPEYIQFITPPIPEFSDIILPRHNPAAYVLVSDTRVDKTAWVIWAKITGPLQTAENDVLENAVVFVQEEDEIITMSTTLIPVYTDGPYPDTPFIYATWDNNRGILARITEPIRSGKRYSTQLGWVVYPEGIQPEEED